MNQAATELLEDEILREQKMFREGRERYMSRQERNSLSSTQTNPHKLITDSLPKVSEALKKTIVTEANKKEGRKYSWFADVVSVDTDLLAYIGLNTCMDAVAIGASLTSAITKIGLRIELEAWAKGLKEHDKALSRRIENKVTRDHSSERYRVKAARIIASKGGYEIPKWTEERRVKAAAPVINAILEHSGIFDVWEQSRPKNTVRRIGLTTEASDRLAMMDFQSSWQEPMLAPMIVEPKPWTSFDTGCYYDEVTSALVPLVRGAVHSQAKAIEHQFKDNKELPDYVEALNAIQSTPLCINRYVLEAVNWAWEQGLSFGKFPRRDKLEHLKRPDNWEDMSAFDRKGWTLKAREVRTKNREIDGSRALMLQDLTTANELVTFEQFWLPWNFDFRGRVYPVPHFSYHRDDHIKSLFLLKNGKPMDDNAAFWLAVHIANVGDFGKISKQSLETRVQWVEDNKDKLYDVGRNAVATFDYWSTADKPFQFLAACHEFANYMDYGDDYVCGLAPALDGTNSGVQHYAAASLNEADGKLVNLVPSDKPQDIYATVAEVVRTKLVNTEDALAKKWLEFGIHRSTVKRNTMTYGYSSAKFGFGDQLFEDIMRPLADKVMRGEIKEHPFGDMAEQKQAAVYLASVNYSAVQEVISSAASGMAFFQKVAGALAHEGKPLRFTTPVGFPVIQKYTYWDVKKVKIYLHDREAGVLNRTQISVREKANRRIDKKKAKAAVSPNIIHSMDSAHLLLTVLTAKQNGVNDFFLIHDSFGTTPADTDVMYQSVRATFIEIYQDYCLYKDFLKQTTAQLSIEGVEKLSIEIPPKGSLAISQIAESEYCFS
jgi:DNA-directed RNA polymerase, mitochondrial